MRACNIAALALSSPFGEVSGKSRIQKADILTHEECEKKLKALIAETNAERKNLKEQPAGAAPPEKLTKKQRKLWKYAYPQYISHNQHAFLCSYQLRMIQYFLGKFSFPNCRRSY